MKQGLQETLQALHSAFLRDHPAMAAHAVNRLELADLAELLLAQPTADRIQLWDELMLDTACQLLPQLPDDIISQILQRGDPVHLARVLVRFSDDERRQYIDMVDGTRKRELTTLAQYPDDTAGTLMDPRFTPLFGDLDAREALRRIRRSKTQPTRQLYLLDDAGGPHRMVEMHRLALAEPEEKLVTLAQPVPAVVTATASREEVVEQLEQHRISDLPVIDVSGRLIGIIHYDVLMEAVREESSMDVLTMVGVSREERALSSIGLVVRKRLPWLSINLLTAFLAAAVVGLFESTIAKFTALAVLLPVVAGQSGNTGAQALAVTMRGLALREIGASQWWPVAKKEIGAAFLNGFAIALLTAFGVFFWSASTGLSLVIGLSMILAMMAASLAGVVIPLVLAALGQDPAQSSSVILTTVTDVVGFSTFLGIATLLSGML